MTDRFFDTGITSDNSGFFAPQNQTEPKRSAPPPPTREFLIDTYNLDLSNAEVINALNKYDELKNSDTIPDFLHIKGGKIVAPFKKSTEETLLEK